MSDPADALTREILFSNGPWLPPDEESNEESKRVAALIRAHDSALVETLEGKLAEAKAERDDLRRGVCMPGAQECVVCGFSAQKMVMRAEDGAVGMNAAAPLEDCPNGCGPMIATTWEHAFRETMARAEQLLTESAERARQVEALREALGKISEIRNSIIGLQSINWSEHIYPLVAALEAAGFEGLPYPEAKARFGTMLERTNAAESLVEALTKRLAEFEAHERETHETLGAILGTDDSLERCALRLTKRLEAAEKVIEAARDVVRVTNPYWGGPLVQALSIFDTAQA